MERRTSLLSGSTSPVPCAFTADFKTNCGQKEEEAAVEGGRVPSPTSRDPSVIPSPRVVSLGIVRTSFPGELQFPSQLCVTPEEKTITALRATLSAQQETEGGGGDAQNRHFHQTFTTPTRTTMSMYGSNQRLNTLGPRSNSRPDLSTFRNDVFVGGNGYAGDYHEGGGGYGYTTTTFSRSSMHGGGQGDRRCK
ncbi:hypothetical protein WMY93_001308 [Mugilogobius chulae]|uniref:Uncharacterized protein n=1 Tax=Mugilogobius chulae TaxID=88201 RepID=A0AAW0QCL2_9GOBI